MPRLVFLPCLLWLLTLGLPPTVQGQSQLLRPEYNLGLNPSANSGAPRQCAFGAEAGEGLGRIIRTGDLNGDLYQDLIVGTDTGKVYIWFGSSGPNAFLDAAGMMGVPAHVTLSGFAALTALAVGDVNGDGKADLVIGITPIKESRANVAVVLGRTSFPQNMDLQSTGANRASVLIDPASDSDALAAGGALILGDLNADGKMDIIVGAPGADGHNDNHPDAGEAYVFLGRVDFPEWLSTGPYGGGSTLFGGYPGDALTQGGTMHVADLNGDGEDDLILGAANATTHGYYVGAGAAYIIYGGHGKFNPGTFRSLDYDADVTVYGEDSGDGLTKGRGIASGDLNGDGIKDLILGAPNATPPVGGRQRAGVAYVIMGNADLPRLLDINHPGHSGEVVKFYGAAVDDGLTSDGALGTADLNGDGITDLMMGAHSATNTISGGHDAGQVYVVLGRKSPAAWPSVVDMKPSPPPGMGEPDVTIHGAYGGDHLSRGGALVTGDLDGDGLTDLILGADAASASGLGGGRAYVIPGRSIFRRDINLRQVGDSNDGAKSIIRAGSNDDALTQGGALALADLNRDGAPDLILGSPQADGPHDERLSAGEVYVIQGVKRAEIALAGPDGGEIFADGMANVGDVGLGGEIPISFTLKNTGSEPLWIYHVSPNGGPNHELFELAHDSHGLIPPRGSRTFDVLFMPKSLGDKRGTFYIRSDDADEGNFFFELRVKVVAATAPTARTLAAVPGVRTAKVSGLVGVRGDARRVFFDYGLTTHYDQQVEVASVADDFPANQPVEGTLTNLLPHTRYYYRIRASSLKGTASGANMTFVTGNSPPLAHHDFFGITDGSKVKLDPVGINDSDPDGDVLSIASFTQPKVEGRVVGSLAKVGNQLVYTAPANFSTLADPWASFTYVAKDAFGGSSYQGIVTLRPASVSLSPETMALSSAGGNYDIEVTSSGLWSVSESAPWVTAVPNDSEYPVMAQITVLPNISTVARTTLIKIGGQTHTITQAGVGKPSIALPAAGVPGALISRPYELQIETQGAPVTYTVTKLPPGLTINQSNGLISGKPTLAGTYAVTVKARNAAAVADEVLSFDIEVEPLHSDLAGTYLGFLSESRIGAARLELTVTLRGGVTGKFIHSQSTRSFAGTINVDEADPAFQTMMIPYPVTDYPDSVVLLKFEPETQTVTGSFMEYPSLTYDPQVLAWRNGWNASTRRATAYKGLNSFIIQATVPGTPRGWGFGSFTVNELTGALTVSGKLSDNSAFLTSGFVGQNGQVLIFQPLYNKKGYFGGVIEINDVAPAFQGRINNVASNPPVWHKPASPASANDTLYADGFDRVLVEVAGDAQPVPGPGEVILGLGNEDNNTWIQLAFSAESADQVYPLSIRNPTTNGLTQKVTVVPPVQHKFTLSSLNPVTGAFSGTFTIPGPTPALARNITYQGQIVRIGSTIDGYGFCLIPELPDATGENLSNTPKWSNPVLLMGLH